MSLWFDPESLLQAILRALAKNQIRQQAPDQTHHHGIVGNSLGGPEGPATDKPGFRHGRHRVDKRRKWDRKGTRGASDLRSQSP